MEIKNSKLSLKSYLDFSNLLDAYRGSHEDNRLFALEREDLLTKPKELLLAWFNSNQFRVKGKFKSESYIGYLSSITTVIAFFSLLMGFFVGFGLLNYSGEAPVNIIYYLLIAMVFPLFSMLLSLLSMFRRGGVINFLNLFLPLHWIEKLFMFIPSKNRDIFLETKLSFGLAKWLFMQRIQLFSLLFSIGLLFALLILVVAKDIAFGWSTTLQVTPDSFHNFLVSIGVLWQEILPSAVPSLELVEMSQYFRLGEKLDSSMIANADKLGAWWQFLAMTTLVYAIVLRFLLWLISKIGFKKQLERDFWDLEGVDGLLREFQTPFVTTKSPKQERHLEIVEEREEQISKSSDGEYHYILGWNFSKSEMRLANDNRGIRGSVICSVGGNNSFSEDESIVEEATGVVLLYVKAWEPPTMDFVDLLEMLIESQEVERVEIYPLGTVGRYYEVDAKDIAVWRRKIDGLKSKKVCVIDV